MINHIQAISSLSIGMLIAVVGCATPTAQLANVPQVAEDKASGRLFMGPFVDMRKGGNVDSTILGTKRGGYGNPLGRVRDERGADEFVREHLINSARASHLFAERTPENLVVNRQGNRWVLESGKERYDKKPILVGVINQLIVETMFSRGTDVDIDLELIDIGTGKIVWTGKLVRKESGGMGGGIFEDLDNLKSWLAKTLQDEALIKFASPEFREEVKKGN